MPRKHVRPWHVFACNQADSILLSHKEFCAHPGLGGMFPTCPACGRFMVHILIIE